MDDLLSSTSKWALHVIVVLLCWPLAGCGGGGGGSRATATPTPNPGPVADVGLDSRPNNTSCVAPARTTMAASLTLVNAFPNLPALQSPMKLVQPPGDSDEWYAVGRSGSLDRFRLSSGASSLERYLNLSVTASGEGGFLSAVLHPDWPSRKELFVSYTIDAGGFESRLSRLVISNDSTLPASYSEEVLLRIEQPFSNHNGGDLDFGPDGFLYYSMGDGGDSGDPFDYGQNTTRLLGSIIRIDVEGVAFPSPGYDVPGDNPFAGNPRCGATSNAAACPEIFAWGLRNPWRMSFDLADGSLWVGDVGQGSWEEIDLVTVGGNYGWRCREGSQSFNTSGCPNGPFEEPIFDYGHGAGDRSVTGGFVYRGSAVPDLSGRYIFADYVSGRVWALSNLGGTYVRELLLETGFNIAGFSQGNDGEVYVLDIGSGRVLRFEASGSSPVDNVAELLTDTGCFDPNNPSEPTEGLIPYQPSAPFWSDGAEKQRWLALPNGTEIDPSAAIWSFPEGTVLAKHFELNGTLLETRLFMRHPDGAWAGYSYRWNDTQTQAQRVRDGENRDLGGQTWRYPSEVECLVCHTQVSGFALGLETAQLNRDFLYPGSNISDNQLEVFNHIGLFTQNLPEPVANLPSLVSPSNAGAGLEDRARAYLHSNCAQCHQPGGPTGVDLDLRFDTTLAEMGVCDVPPQAGSLGIGNARLLAPGDPGRSILIQRSDRLDADRMPPLAFNEIDSTGVQLLSDWVSSVTTCP
ncbi:MAG: PQQ-dependent sugar dehydrogenase [Pseudomonadales bacterium]